jgi:diguanylate cyclase (GGDEF)-like protein
MNSYERNYRYLLLNLIPRHRLPPVLRRDVEQALVTGSQEELRRQSILALEELCRSNYLERVDTRTVNGDIIVNYKRKGGRYNVSVSLPGPEWEQYAVAGTGPGRIVPVAEPLEEKPVAPASAQPATAPAVEPVAEPVPEPPEPPTDTAASPPASEFLDFVPEITRVFSVSARSDPILNRLDELLETIRGWLGISTLNLLLLEEIANRSEIRGEWLETVSERYLRENGVYRAAIQSGLQNLLTPNRAAGVLDDNAPDSWAFLGIAPLFAMGKVCGILKMYFGDGFDEDTANRRLEAATNVVRQAIEFNSQIETITSVDALTQVYNRHFYDSQVSVEIERAMRSGNEVSMLVIDLDDFKKVNDELGHKKGDEALGAVAELIRKNLRKVDLPFRYGGEEFVILLPGTSEFESVHTAERLRRKIADYAGFRDLHGRPRAITVSIGVSVFPDTATSAEELFVQADSAMYRAKQLGKNRVVLYKHGMSMGQE